jgi:hypothetical protein
MSLLLFERKEKIKGKPEGEHPYLKNVLSLLKIVSFFVTDSQIRF